MADKDMAEVESDELVDAVEATRTRLETSFEELQRRLDPGYQMEKIMESAQQQASEATSAIGESLRGAAKKAVEFGRRNPTMMTSGIMLAAFDGVTFMLRRSFNEWLDTAGTRQSAKHSSNRDKGVGEDARASMQSMADQVRHGVADSADQAGDILSKGRDALRGKASSLAEQSRDSLDAAQERVMEGYDRASAFVQRLSREHPMVMMTTAVAAGMLIATLLPRTRVEEKTLGGLGQTLAQSASTVADRANQALKSAGRVGETVQTAHRSPDTTGGTSVLGSDD